MKVVLDCNVLISAGITDGVCRAVLRYTLRHAAIVTTGAIEREYIDVMGRTKFRTYADTMMTLFSEVRQVAFCVHPKPSGFSLPDKNDLPYLDAATTMEVDFLITGNLKHFPERRYGRVEVVDPKGFLQRVVSC
uniref:Predicted nucleic acid-binding protein, contains PIN domain n=1 Tax=Candidatus Kentrum sp. DK TaxID=2126562 RepID=A0A450SIX2_9GAMM|nr:MAG: Predicted nucleic acid-binding protein, contains PIN domain [Candidatus Kentron sp. DK]